MRSTISNLLAAVVLCALFLAVGPPAFAVDNDLDLHGFTAPVLVSLSDATIAIGDAVWRSADGIVYVVQAKAGSGVTLVDPKSPGFVRVISVQSTEKAIHLAHITIDVPGGQPPPAPPSSTASAP